jgi:Uma2 family endonuclease
MVANARKKWTVEEYLAFERSSEEKHEYWDGNISLVNHPPQPSERGIGRQHSLIVTNIICSLGNQIVNMTCEAYPLDMCIKVSASKYLYSDMSIVYDRPQFSDDTFDTLLNPTVIIEVLSDSTEKYDRGKKFEHYRTLESLQEYVLIAQDEIHIEHYIRTAGKWVLTEAKTIDAIVELSSLGCTLLLADVYRKVTFEADDSLKDA